MCTPQASAERQHGARRCWRDGSPRPQLVPGGRVACAAEITGTLLLSIMPRRRQSSRAESPVDGAIVRPIAEEAQRALDALREAAATLQAMHAFLMRLAALERGALPRSGTLERLIEQLPAAPLDAIAHQMPDTRALVAPMRAAGAAFVKWASASDASAPARVRDVAARAATLRERVTAIEEQLREPLAMARQRRPTRRQERALAEHVGEFVREQGLERADVSVRIGETHQKEPVAFSVPVPAATAHVWLTQKLYERIELSVVDDPLVTLECMAARWQFARWGGDASVNVPGDEFGRSVREQEYVFVLRPMVSLDATLMETLELQPWFREIPARQRAMALALADSVDGIFRVVAREGAVTVFEHGETGEQYRVHEHNPDLPYTPNDVAIGLLMPWTPKRGKSDDFAWLRSPGMAFLETDDPAYARHLVQTLASTEGQLTPPAAREALIATALAQPLPTLPLPIPPAPSREDADVLRVEAHELLQEAGLVRHVGREELSPELRAQVEAVREESLGEMVVDLDLAQWLAALQAQGGGGPGGGSARRGDVM